MYREYASTLPKLSSEENFRRKLRDGQISVRDYLKSAIRASLNVKFPGGYGKSLAIALAFRCQYENSLVDRLLIVVANNIQKSQILKDFKHDCLDVAMDVGEVWDVTNEPATLKASRSGKHVVFVTTIQQVFASYNSEMNSVLALMRSGGNWMLAADEYHHYADDMPWGDAITVLQQYAKFNMALSATPDRDGPTTVFGKPDITVDYEKAARDRCVKHLLRRTYDHEVDGKNTRGEDINYTTHELRQQTNECETLPKRKIQSELRYKSSYVLDIITCPLTRLLDRQIETGLPLQMLIRAMDCRHAEVVCNLVKSLDTSLSVDWIGTGEHGRNDVDNDRIKTLFCPPKDENGRRPRPTLDVLVQVGMAGEGFDSLYVAEIVDLSNVTLEGSANQTKQFYLRGSRFIEYSSSEDIVCFINVPTDHPLAGLSSNQLEKWIDSNTSIDDIKNTITPQRDTERKDFEFPKTWPSDLVEATKLITIDEDQLCVFKKECAKVYTDDGNPRTVDDISDDVAERAYRRIMTRKSEEQSKSIGLAAKRKLLDKLAGKVASYLLRVNISLRNTMDVGGVKKRINRKMKNIFGSRDSLLENDLNRSLSWLNDLYDSAMNGDTPEWLS